MKIEFDVQNNAEVALVRKILGDGPALTGQAAPQPQPTPAAPQPQPQPQPAAPAYVPPVPQPGQAPPAYVPQTAQPAYTPQPAAGQVTLDDLKRQIQQWATQPGNAPSMLQPVFQKAGAPNVTAAGPDQLALISQVLGMSADQRTAWLAS